jgi:hypothetical protein
MKGERKRKMERLDVSRIRKKKTETGSKAGALNCFCAALMVERANQH